MMHPGTRIKIEDTIGAMHNAIFWCLENLENEDWITLDDPEPGTSLLGRTPDKWREWKDRAGQDYPDSISATGIFIFSEKVVKDPIITEFLLKFT